MLIQLILALKITLGVASLVTFEGYTPFFNVEFQASSIEQGNTLIGCSDHCTSDTSCVAFSVTNQSTGLLNCVLSTTITTAVQNANSNVYYKKLIPIGVNDAILGYDGMLYKILDAGKSFDEAEDACLELEGNYTLGIYDSDLKSSALKKLIPSGSTAGAAWVNLVKNSNLDSFWANGVQQTSGNTYNFDSMDDNDDDEFCFRFVRSSNKLKDTYCTSQPYLTVCQRTMPV